MLPIADLNPMWLKVCGVPCRFTCDRSSKTYDAPGLTGGGDGGGGDGGGGDGGGEGGGVEGGGGDGGGVGGCDGGGGEGALYVCADKEGAATDVTVAGKPVAIKPA